MRQIINIAFLFFSVSTFGQNSDIKGHVIHGQDSIDFAGVTISLIKEGNIVFGDVTDRKGNYEIKNIPIGNYDIKLSFIGFKKKLITNYELKSGLQNIDFIYPNPCKVADKICPYGHSDNLIPIIYGYPGKRLIEKAEKGQIKLGVCIISDCDPKWYCKEHEIYF